MIVLIMNVLVDEVVKVVIKEYYEKMWVFI